MDNIASLFVLQKATYTLPIAYDYFCSELEKMLVAIFEDKEEPKIDPRWEKLNDFKLDDD